MIDKNETPNFIAEKKRLKCNLNTIKLKTKYGKQFLWKMDNQISKNDSIDEVLEEFVRPRKLGFNEIKPLLVIRSPRDIPEVQKCYDVIDFIDKVWIKYYNDSDMQDEVRKYVKDHPEYTHIILSSDDIYVSIIDVLTLIDDVLKYDFPAISGCCNMCFCYKSDPTGTLKKLGKNIPSCDDCEKGNEHQYVNVTIKPVEYLDENDKRKYIVVQQTPPPFEFLTTEYVKNHRKIIQCWFQGFAFGIIRRDVFDEIGCQPYMKSIGLLSDDFAFAVDCSEKEISQFTDLRVHMKHDARYHGKLKVGKKESKIVFEERKSMIVPMDAIGKLDMSDYAPILVCCPFNNEEQSIDLFVKGMLNIDYPKELIDLIWVENDSIDKTWEKLQTRYDEIKSKYKYHSFRLLRQNYGLKRLGKSSMEDFAKAEAGKNILYSMSDRVDRGKRLCDIYHFFFEQIDKNVHKYLMFLFTDVIVPHNIITRYLEVFKEYPDAGWVGGVHHKRYPLHMRRNPSINKSYAGLAGPLKKVNYEPFIEYMTDDEILMKQISGEVVFECAMTGHVWMVKPEIYLEGGKMEIDGVEIVYPFIKKLWNMGLKVYCVSDIYLQHISLDGKIYRHNLLEEVEYFHKMKMIDESKVKIIEKTQIDEDYEEYMDFIKRHYPERIPPKPHSINGRTMDSLRKEIITFEQWMSLYGKWESFINNSDKKVK